MIPSNLPPKNNQPIGPHNDPEPESLFIQIDMREPELAAAQTCPLRMVLLHATHVSAEELKAAFRAHDHIGGCFQASEQIVLMRGALVPKEVPALVPLSTPKAVMCLPPHDADGAEDVFFVAYRNALGAMLERADFGFRVTFYGPRVLCFHAHRDIPAGQIEFVVRGEWSGGLPAVAPDPSEFPQRVLQEIMLLARQYRDILHWPERGLVPSYPEDEQYHGPGLSVHSDLIEPGLRWPFAMMAGCTNATRYWCVRPDSTLAFANVMGGKMEILYRQPSELMQRGRP